MANKVKKRGNSELNVADESGNANPPGQEVKKTFKKAKGNQNSPQKDNKPKEAQLAKTSHVNNVNAPGESKNLKKKKGNIINSGFQVTQADSDKKDVKPKKNKVVDPSVAIEKKLKARQITKEKRKKLRQEHGQNNMQITMSPDDMKKKIQEIQSRENLTKTAKRKLRILKKKLQIAEGTFVPSPVKVSKEGVLAKTQKKKLKKEKLQLKVSEQTQNDAVDSSINQKLIKKKLDIKESAIKQEESGKTKVELGLNSMKSNLKKKTPQKNLQKSGQKIKVPVESEEEDDDNEDESLEEAPVKMEADETSEGGDEDQEEDDNEEGEESDDNEDEEEGEEEGEEADDNEDEQEGEESNDDDDDDDEEAHKIIPKSLKKTSKNVKKEPEGNKKAPTPKIPSQENGDKKQRYVLFVGNLPFKASVEDVKKHFLQKVSEVVSVRIPTDKETKKPRGFGYVEVSNNVDFEKALSLHQSSLQGFKINVEYTHTGSKNIKNKQELVAKNKKLHAIRKAGKLAGSKKENQKRSFRRNLKKNQKFQED